MVQLLVSSVMPLVVRQGMIVWVSQRRGARSTIQQLYFFEDDSIILYRCKSCPMQYLRFLVLTCVEIALGKWHKTDMIAERNVPLVTQLGIGCGNTLAEDVGLAQIHINQLVSCVFSKVKD